MKNPPPGRRSEAGSRFGARRWALTPHEPSSTLSLRSAYIRDADDATLVAV